MVMIGRFNLGLVACVCLLVNMQYEMQIRRALEQHTRTLISSPSKLNIYACQRHLQCSTPYLVIAMALALALAMSTVSRQRRVDYILS